MNSRSRTISMFFLLGAMLTGCASTQVTQQTPVVGSKLPRPNQVWVYDFIADPAKIPADSWISTKLSAPSTPPTTQELETGRQLGALMAKNVVADIQSMGLSAVQAGPSSSPQVGDLIIHGYLISVEGGSTVKRFVIGFGTGSPELDTVIEGYDMTNEGLRQLGSGTLSSSGNKTPGIIAPAAITIATGSPIGLIIVGTTRVYGEVSGRNTLEARVKPTTDAIAELLRTRFRNQGWIS